MSSLQKNETIAVLNIHSSTFDTSSIGTNAVTYGKADRKTLAGNMLVTSTRSRSMGMTDRSQCAEIYVEDCGHLPILSDTSSRLRHWRRSKASQRIRQTCYAHTSPPPALHFQLPPSAVNPFCPYQNALEACIIHTECAVARATFMVIVLRDTTIVVPAGNSDMGLTY